MTANNLLLWMSARREGSWFQFKSAVEELHLTEQVESGEEMLSDESVEKTYGLSLFQKLRLNLEALAHAEFFKRKCENGWRVVPPSLAISRSSEGWVGVLCGARSSNLLARFIDVSSPEKLEVAQVEACPDQMIITAPSLSRLVGIAHKCSLLTQVNAPEAILLSWRPLFQIAFQKQTDLPIGSGWIVERFSSSSLKWRPSTHEEAVRSRGGFFRFSLGYRYCHILCLNGNAFEVHPRIGKYFVLARSRHYIIRYDNQGKQLFLPASCRPPILIERALNLCSGLPASFDATTGMLQYIRVPETVARYACALLNQEII